MNKTDELLVKIHEALLKPRKPQHPAKITLKSHEVPLIVASHLSFFYEIAYNPGIFASWLIPYPAHFKYFLQNFSDNLKIILNDKFLKKYDEEVLPWLMRGNIKPLLELCASAPEFSKYFSQAWDSLRGIIDEWEKTNRVAVSDGRQIRFYGFIPDGQGKQIIEYVIENEEMITLQWLLEMADSSLLEGNVRVNDKFFILGLKCAFEKNSYEIASIILFKYPHLANLSQEEMKNNMKKKIDSQDNIDGIMTFFHYCEKTFHSNFYRAFNNFVSNPNFLNLKLKQFCLEKAAELLKHLSIEQQAKEKDKLDVLKI